MKNGTQNFYPEELAGMVNYPNKRANEIGNRLPYHLQYLRDGKPNVKPEVKKSESNS